MKILIFLLFIIIITLIYNVYTNNYKENMCGDYTFSYLELDHFWNNKATDDLISAYNIKYKKNLIDDC